LKEEYIMKKLYLSFIALTMASAIFAGNKQAQYLAVAQIVDIEEIYRTNKVKRYSDCREVANESVTTTLCDNIEWKTINKSIDHYRVTYNLYGKTFSIKEKTRPIGTERRMRIIASPYR
jgi:hypothetical protein